MKHTVCNLEGKPIETVGELRRWLEPLTGDTLIYVELELLPLSKKLQQLLPEKNTCQTCIWFEKSGKELEMSVGNCRRHAPTIDGYPACYPNDWCGDHTLSENQVG